MSSRDLVVVVVVGRSIFCSLFSCFRHGLYDRYFVSATLLCIKVSPLFSINPQQHGSQHFMNFWNMGLLIRFVHMCSTPSLLKLLLGEHQIGQKGFISVREFQEWANRWKFLLHISQFGSSGHGEMKMLSLPSPDEQDFSQNCRVKGIFMLPCWECKLWYHLWEKEIPGCHLVTKQGYPLWLSSSSTCPAEMRAHVGQNSCSGMFAEVLFTLAPNWSSSFTMGKWNVGCQTQSRSKWRR